jgi:hypothetical protein
MERANRSQRIIQKRIKQRVRRGVGEREGEGEREREGSVERGNTYSE